MKWLRQITAVDSLDTSEGVSRRLHLVLTLLNLFVLIALVLIHIGFSDALGQPPAAVYLLIVLRAAVLIGEAYYVSDVALPLPFTSSKRFAFVSIGANLLFAFAVGYVADLHDSHYHVLMVLPVVSAAFQFSIYWTIAAATAATLLTFLQLVLYYGRHPPFDDDEFFEGATMTVVYFLVAFVVWILVRQLRNDQERLRESIGELQKTQGQLVAEEKLAAVGRLASAVAHEIRNPVAMINSSLQIMSREGEYPERDRREMFEIARKESNRLTQLTTDFLNFARPRVPEQSSTNARYLLDYAASVVLPNAARRQQNCVVECDADLQLIVDPFQMHQLLVNLALNALDASADGATIRLWARAGPAGGTQIGITNPGPLIPEKIVQRIFEPFFTTKQHGTGLGLAIARNIAQSHSSELRLSENTAQRVTFSLDLPGIAKV